MSNNNAKAAPSANVKPDSAAGPVKLDMKDPAILKHAAVLTKATAEESKARENAALELERKAGGTWAVLRDEVAATLKELGPVNAGLVLDVYLLECKTEGGMTATRGAQYAANLRRMVTAAKAGKELPAEVAKAGRSEYLAHPFWTDAGILKKTGTKKGQTTAASEKKAAKDGEKADGPSIGKAAEKAAQDKGMGDLLELVGQLHGPFKAEFYGRAKELARELLSKQGKATGTGQS